MSADYRYQGHIGAALVLGGVDSTGPHLYSVWPHGSTDVLPYVTMGMCLQELFLVHPLFQYYKDDQYTFNTCMRLVNLPQILLNILRLPYNTF